MRRNNRDIEADILKIAIKGTKKTWIVYGANLNFRIVQRYLGTLIERGLLTLENKIYQTTRLGLEYLERINDVRCFY